MLRAFNAFQLVSVFTAMPFLIGWLDTTPFRYAGAAYWTAITAYVVMFIGGVCILADYLRHD